MIDSGFDPAVIPIIARVAQLAGNSTLVVNQDGQTFTVQEKFELDMVDVIKTAHWMADDDPMLLKRAKRVRQLACKLEGELRDGYLSRRLPFSEVKAVSTLVNEHGRSRKWAETIRKRFVYGLLNATDAAGGSLVVNQRNGRGSLVEALTLLQPHLPELFKRGLGEETLRKIKRAWVKNRKK